MITSKNITNGNLDFSNVKNISKEDFEQINKRSLVENGDVLYAMIGTIGFPVLVDTTEKFAIKNVALFKKDKNNILNNKYLKEILNHEIVKNQILYEEKGSARKFVSLFILRNLKIPLPPLEIQKKIVSEIEVLEAKEKKAKAEIEKSKEAILNLFNQLEAKADKIVRLSDETMFQVSIGKRVLKNEFVENGKIPVYSANVIEPFGNIDKLLIEDFSKPSVLWGIDGDWMVNHLPIDYPFYPTDHCGVLRVKDNSINEKYLAFILEKEGKAFEFSRTKRASIDRIQGIKIAVPPIFEQQKIVSEIEKIEVKIKFLEAEIAAIPKQKEAVLKNYL